MIVRVFEARAVPGEELRLAVALRDDMAAARRQPGLISVHLGRRVDHGETRIIVISEWQDLDAVRAWLGPTYLLPRYAPGEDRLVEEARVRHYEGLEP